MEKLIYLLYKNDSLPITSLSDVLLTTVIDTLRSCGASNITVNIADMNEDLQPVAPGRFIGPYENVAAAVSLWHDTVDARRSIEDCLISATPRISGYLVTESVPQPYEHEWKEGERRPGVTQFGANDKPRDISDEVFFQNWAMHSEHSFELHPLRWSYVRNAVARPLTEGATQYRAIVLEHFREVTDFTDDQRYFGSEQAVQQMLADIAGFCDFESILSLPMSEFYFR